MLFAILVTTIGLLGAIAVFPVASAQARKGRINDALAVAGHQAVHQFDAMEMRSDGAEGRWMAYNSTNSQYEKFGHVLAQCYCIDPRYIAANSGTSASAIAAADFPAFPVPPYVAANKPPTMLRLTLSSGTVNGSGLPLPMNQLHADSIFIFDDDLAYGRPDDRSLEPGQLFDTLTSDGVTTTKRQAEGNMSWMATLVPKLELMSAVPNDLYVLSIVMFYQRPADLSSLSERSLFVEAMPGLGVTGGEIAVTSANEADLKIRPGDWIMLAGESTPGDGNANNGIKTFKWYRVTDCDPEVETGGLGFRRYVTLMGEDWFIYNPTLNLGFGSPPDAAGTLTTTFPRAVLVDGVVGVYEKTIRLETGP